MTIEGVDINIVDLCLSINGQANCRGEDVLVGCGQTRGIGWFFRLSVGVVLTHGLTWASRLDPHEQLTHDGVRKFSREFARVRGRDLLRVWGRAHSALRNWSQALQSLGVSLPQWRSEADRESREQPEVLKEFRNHL